MFFYIFCNLSICFTYFGSEWTNYNLYFWQNKTIGQVTLVRQGILGTHVARHLLRDISLVELEIYVYKFQYIDKTYNISLVLMSGNSIPLNLAALYDEKKVRDTAGLICSFLNLRPYTETKINRWYW